MTTKLDGIRARAALAHTELQWEQSAGSVCDEFFDGDMPLLLAVAEAAAALGPDVFDDIRTLLGDVLRLTAAHPIMLALDALDAAIAPLLAEEAD